MCPDFDTYSAQISPVSSVESTHSESAVDLTTENGISDSYSKQAPDHQVKPNFHEVVDQVKSSPTSEQSSAYTLYQQVPEPIFSSPHMVKSEHMIHPSPQSSAEFPEAVSCSPLMVKLEPNHEEYSERVSSCPQIVIIQPTVYTIPQSPKKLTNEDFWCTLSYQEISPLKQMPLYRNTDMYCIAMTL